MTLRSEVSNVLAHCVRGGLIFWGQESVCPFSQTEDVIYPWAIIASHGKMYPMPERDLEETQLTSRDIHQYLLG